GLRFLESEPEPCCLVLDLSLPDGDGELVLRRLRDRGLRSRVVVATGVVDGKRLESVAALGLDALLTKPIHLADVWGGDKSCRVCGQSEAFDREDTQHFAAPAGQPGGPPSQPG
ncbi:MAG: response regulator, partial [Planctomycetia bacterium]|nr:response regulator [Planctomycetia bacterium]